MSSFARSWIALGLLAFIGNAAVRPAVAAAATGDEQPATPSGDNAAAPELVKVHRPRPALATAGAITFAVSWGIAATFSAMATNVAPSDCGHICEGAADYLWIPIVGPAMVLDGTGVLWSAVQAAGFAMLVAGLAGHDVMERRVADRGPTLQLAPLFERDSNGIALTGRW